jgi:aspartyl-tRNA(Asn)/glutamyl-tRNA(Gln) amidotransferase subunit A
MLDGQTISFRRLVLPYTMPQDVAGLPACTIRAGFDDENVPIGMQLSAARWREDLVLRAGHALLTATPALQQRWPKLPRMAPDVTSGSSPADTG